MKDRYDALEARSTDERAKDLSAILPDIVKAAQRLVGNTDRLAGIEAASVDDNASLVGIPVFRKTELLAAQAQTPPLGGLVSSLSDFSHVFQSPGPIYEPGEKAGDFWRFGRAAYAAGLGAADIVQNCFSYHFTPAGQMFDSAAQAVGATVFPAGTGQTELQARAAEEIGVTAYAGTPDYLRVILDQAASDGRKLAISKAMVSGGALFPAVRQGYADAGISCLQCYGTADLGLIAYESAAMDGMIIDEGVVVEIVRPGTGDPLPDGEVGEVVVTLLNPAYPLVRFATGDMSAIMPGQSPCGRTNSRIKGWMGRADQTTKVKGMFVRPEQVADFVSANESVSKARVVVSRDGDSDVMSVQVEAVSANPETLANSVRQILKLGAAIEILAPGSLPNDGLVIEDQRSYD